MTLGRVSDLGSKGHEVETHWRHCVVSLRKTLYPLLVQPRKTGKCPNMTEQLLTETESIKANNMS